MSCASARSEEQDHAGALAARTRHLGVRPRLVAVAMAREAELV